MPEPSILKTTLWAPGSKTVFGDRDQLELQKCCHFGLRLARKRARQLWGKNTGTDTHQENEQKPVKTVS